MTNTMTREALREAMNKGAPTLIEALPEKYYNEGHIPGAIQINHNEIDEKAIKLLPNKNQQIVVYCASDTCANSERAANQLTQKGYTHVATYVGGKKDWTDAGLPLEK